MRLHGPILQRTNFFTYFIGLWKNSLQTKALPDVKTPISLLFIIFAANSKIGRRIAYLTTWRIHFCVLRKNGPLMYRLLFQLLPQLHNHSNI